MSSDSDLLHEFARWVINCGIVGDTQNPYSVAPGWLGDWVDEDLVEALVEGFLEDRTEDNYLERLQAGEFWDKRR